MWEEIKISQDDVVAVVAPHPDDECLGASYILLTMPERTDVYVLTDGSHGDKEKTVEEEAQIRKAQFYEEMSYVKPRNVYWLGYEDTTLPKHYEAADSIDFSKYTKVFLPWNESAHPDHRAASVMCCRAIKGQKASPECYFYEITVPFRQPTHYADISHLIDEKRRLIDFHRDQAYQKDITCNLNLFRGSVISMRTPVKYAECYLKADPSEIGYTDDILIKLNSFKEDHGIYDRLLEQGIQIKRAMPCDLAPLQEFIRDNFGKSWADEILPAVINGSCFIAVRDKKIVGFNCAQATAKGFVGPAGTLSSVRRMGIHRALLQRCLRYMIEHNYRYAVAGMPTDFVFDLINQVADVQVISNSSSSYMDLIGYPF
ncbi:MAG: PIG-L family deacetylase [Lachnospiraceae bacterium]|nr:PIG-L family deacetylase [Lachnospiraceae bacterium]